jgi:LmbE family N-acetylglucosaminyl deacetylase
MSARNTSRYPAEFLGRSAVVFSPHFDDETLGCGGLIIKKRRAGGSVKIVFMTDGSTSHQHLMPRHELSAVRYREAVEAAGIMGVAEADVIALGFEDQKLNECAEAAAERVCAILEECRPAEIWMPHSSEPAIWSLDHRATTRIVKQAARRSKRGYEVYEYPVWLWYSYPWVDLPLAHPREALALLKSSVAASFGLSLVRTCRWHLDVGDVLEVKRAALAAYRSQMTRLKPDPAWATLGDVANGQFLDCFFTSREVFARCDLGNDQITQARAG